MKYLHQWIQWKQNEVLSLGHHICGNQQPAYKPNTQFNTHKPNDWVFKKKKKKEDKPVHS